MTIIQIIFKFFLSLSLRSAFRISMVKERKKERQRKTYRSIKFI